MFKILGFLLLFAASAQAQPLGAGRYVLDTASCHRCDTGWIPDYYSKRIKYPLSSEALVRKVRAAVVFPKNFKGSGYVTVKFVVNCEGEKNCYHIYETDGRYQPIHFAKEITEPLLQFVKQLGPWPRATGKYRDYFAFLAFKIKDGVITNIIP
ncbi:MAG: hypothetical protein H0X33_01225 [Taibaiella sp.]|nr:hypothetical protein [Taibaiella sp.]